MRREGGYVALLSVLIVGAAATAIALAVLLTGTDAQRAALVLQRQRQARGLAVACGEEAAQQVHDNIAFSGTNNLSLGQGSCTYIVAGSTATTRTISATGTVGTVVKKVTATITVGATTLTMSSWKEAPANGPSTPAFVQLAAATPQSSPTSVAASYVNNEVAGNTNVVVIGWDSTTTTISSVVDNGGNTYQVAAQTTRGTGISQAIYYAKNIVGGNKPTVTVTFSAASAFPDLRIMEYSGLDTTSPLDVSVSGIGSAASSNSGTVNTSYPTDLIVAGGTAQTSYSAAGAGYTLRTLTSPNADIVEDQVVTTSGAYAATATASGNWVMQAVAFRAAGQ